MPARFLKHTVASFAAALLVVGGCGKKQVDAPLPGTDRTFDQVAEDLKSPVAATRLAAAKLLKTVPRKYAGRARSVLQLALKDEPDPQVRATIQDGILANKGR